MHPIDDGLKHDERPRQAARRQDKPKNRTDAKDSTAGAARNRPVCSTSQERKSTRDERRGALLEAMGVPAPWRRLSDVLPPVSLVTEAELLAVAELVDFIRDREAA